MQYNAFKYSTVLYYNTYNSCKIVLKAFEYLNFGIQTYFLRIE